jgi:hypothetical protein
VTNIGTNMKSRLALVMVKKYAQSKLKLKKIVINFKAKTTFFFTER